MGRNGSMRLVVNVLTIGPGVPKIEGTREEVREGVRMRPRFQATRSNLAIRNRLLSTLFRHLPGAWIDPKNNELIALYRLRYKMALEEQKYDTALIFLNKIVELDPKDLEAKLC